MAVASAEDRCTPGCRLDGLPRGPWEGATGWADPVGRCTRSRAGRPRSGSVAAHAPAGARMVANGGQTTRARRLRNRWLSVPPPPFVTPGVPQAITPTQRCRRQPSWCRTGSCVTRAVVRRGERRPIAPAEGREVTRRARRISAKAFKLLRSRLRLHSATKASTSGKPQQGSS